MLSARLMVIRVLVLLAHLSLGGSLLAQDPCASADVPEGNPWDAGAPFRRLVNLDESGCFGGQNDRAGTTKAIRVLTEQAAKADDDQLRGHVSQILGVIVAHAVQLSDQDPRFAELAGQVELARGGLAPGKSPASPTAWQLDGGKLYVLSDQSLQGFVDSACDQRDTDCLNAFAVTKDILRIARLTRRALELSESPLMKKFLDENERRAKLWNEYFETARSQYLWELIINGRLMKDSRQERNGVKRGFRDVPTSQWMILHPDISYEYLDDEAAGSQFKESVVVDVVGYNRWSWRKDGSMGFASGVSLIAAVSDRAGADDFGWGLMVHVNHRWSIGVTDHDGDRGILVSGDLAQLWTKVSEKQKQWLMRGD